MDTGAELGNAREDDGSAQTKRQRGPRVEATIEMFRQKFPGIDPASSERTADNKATTEQETPVNALEEERTADHDKLPQEDPSQPINVPITRETPIDKENAGEVTGSQDKADDEVSSDGEAAREEEKPQVDDLAVDTPGNQGDDQVMLVPEHIPPELNDEKSGPNQDEDDRHKHEGTKESNEPEIMIPEQLPVTVTDAKLPSCPSGETDDVIMGRVEQKEPIGSIETPEVDVISLMCLENIEEPVWSLMEQLQEEDLETVKDAFGILEFVRHDINDKRCSVLAICSRENQIYEMKIRRCLEEMHEEMTSAIEERPTHRPAAPDIDISGPIEENVTPPNEPQSPPPSPTQLPDESYFPPPQPNRSPPPQPSYPAPPPPSHSLPPQPSHPAPPPPSHTPPPQPSHTPPPQPSHFPPPQPDPSQQSPPSNPAPPSLSNSPPPQTSDSPPSYSPPPPHIHAPPPQPSHAPPLQPSHATPPQPSHTPPSQPSHAPPLEPSHLPTPPPRKNNPSSKPPSKNDSTSLAPNEKDSQTNNKAEQAQKVVDEPRDTGPAPSDSDTEPMPSTDTLPAAETDYKSKATDDKDIDPPVSAGNKPDVWEQVADDKMAQLSDTAENMAAIDLASTVTDMTRKLRGKFRRKDDLSCDPKVTTSSPTVTKKRNKSTDDKAEVLMDPGLLIGL